MIITPKVYNVVESGELLKALSQYFNTSMRDVFYLEGWQPESLVAIEVTGYVDELTVLAINNIRNLLPPVSILLNTMAFNREIPVGTYLIEVDF